MVQTPYFGTCFASKYGTSQMTWICLFSLNIAYFLKICIIKQNCFDKFLEMVTEIQELERIETLASPVKSQRVTISGPDSTATDSYGL